MRDPWPGSPEAERLASERAYAEHVEAVKGRERHQAQAYICEDFKRTDVEQDKIRMGHGYGEGPAEALVNAIVGFLNAHKRWPTWEEVCAVRAWDETGKKLWRLR